MHSVTTDNRTEVRSISTNLFGNAQTQNTLMDHNQLNLMYRQQITDTIMGDFMTLNR